MEILVLVLIVFMYFLPTVVANSREHKNKPAICVLNIFLGWTMIGWVIALIWAFTDNTKKVALV